MENVAPPPTRALPSTRTSATGRPHRARAALPRERVRIPDLWHERGGNPGRLRRFGSGRPPHLEGLRSWCAIRAVHLPAGFVSQAGPLRASTGNTSTSELIEVISAISAATPEAVCASFLFGTGAHAASCAPLTRSGSVPAVPAALELLLVSGSPEAVPAVPVA